MTPEQKKWMDNASYEDLLTRWRFGPSADNIFHGDAGTYFKEKMTETRSKLAPGVAATISKTVGWDSPTKMYNDSTINNYFKGKNHG